MIYENLSRELNHRVKSITASIFTPAEIESLKNTGNAVMMHLFYL